LFFRCKHGIERFAAGIALTSKTSAREAGCHKLSFGVKNDAK
jgi:hypothetical protein